MTQIKVVFNNRNSRLMFISTSINNSLSVKYKEDLILERITPKRAFITPFQDRSYKFINLQ